MGTANTWRTTRRVHPHTTLDTTKVRKISLCQWLLLDSLWRARLDTRNGDVMTRTLERIYNIAYSTGQQDMLIPALIYGILCGIGGYIIGVKS